MMVATRSTLVFGVLALASTPLYAQGVFDMGILTGSLSIDHVTQSERARAEGVIDVSKKISRGIDLTPAVRRPAPSALASLNYKPSLERRRMNITRFIAKSRSLDPVGADRMQAVFAANDMIAVGDGEMRKIGLRATNFADAYAYYWAHAWLAAQGRNDAPSKAQMLAVREQAADAIMADDAFANASEATKQEMSEALIVQAMMIIGYIEHGKEQPALMPKVKKAVATGARAMNLDLSAMTLTASGFRPRKGAATGAPVDGPALAVAAPSPAPEVGSGHKNAHDTTTAFIAAAGGAGLVAMFVIGRATARRG